MPAPIIYKSAALVDDKLYVIGRQPNESGPLELNRRELQAHYFNINNQLWEHAPLFVEPFQVDSYSKTRMTVIENILVGHYLNSGLMCYNKMLNEWSRVSYMRPINAKSVALGEYNGKLAILWTKVGDNDGITNKLNLTTITLKKTDIGIRGVADPF